ncbi:uncharacterized protein LOC131428993 [Malaya genurostris]|uniref:uncharacterized protein LOC131428993 n=1 Tax=Malaya genurostris TaxID=325434 RepID=UPI0026F3BBE4|nr:uncharacterized protein LOC131428993 [Malaya genurostris]
MHLTTTVNSDSHPPSSATITDISSNFIQAVQEPSSYAASQLISSSSTVPPCSVQPRQPQPSTNNNRQATISVISNVPYTGPLPPTFSPAYTVAAHHIPNSPRPPLPRLPYINNSTRLQSPLMPSIPSKMPRPVYPRSPMRRSPNPIPFQQKSKFLITLA